MNFTTLQTTTNLTYFLLPGATDVKENRHKITVRQKIKSIKNFGSSKITANNLSKSSNPLDKSTVKLFCKHNKKTLNLTITEDDLLKQVQAALVLLKGQRTTNNLKDTIKGIDKLEEVVSDLTHVNCDKEILIMIQKEYNHIHNKIIGSKNTFNELYCALQIHDLKFYEKAKRIIVFLRDNKFEVLSLDTLKLMFPYIK